MATKVDLAKSLDAMATKVDLAKSLDAMATKVDLAKIAKSINVLTTTVDDLTTTVDNLAIITNRGFENTVSKKEFSEFKEEMADFKGEMAGFKSKTEIMLLSLDSHAEETSRQLKNIEKTLPPLVIMSKVMENEIKDLNVRVERKVA